VSRHRLIPRLLLVAGVAGAVLWAGLHRGQLDPGALDDWLSGLGIWAPVVYVTFYAAGTVAFLPGSLFALAGGALFGPVWGTILNLVGATIGAGIAFLVARYLAGDWVARKAAGRLKRLIAGVEAEGWRFVAFVRLESFRTLAALMLITFGLILLSSRLQAHFASATSALSALGNNALSQVRVQGAGGQLLVGLLLGVAWAPCVGPTLGAASTLAAQGSNLPQVALVMVLFGFGAALPLLVLGTISRAALLRYRGRMLTLGSAGKAVLGAILLAFGLMIVSGLDKRVEAFLVEHSPAWLTELTTRY